MSATAVGAACALCNLDCGTHPLEQPVWGETLSFCCNGCLNVHAILRESGAIAPGVDPRETELYQRSLAMGLISTRERSVEPAAKPISTDGVRREKLLRISGMWCGACAWLIESTLAKERGVISAEVFFASDLCKVAFDPRLTPPGSIESRIASLGYIAVEQLEDTRATERQRKDLLLRLGLAAFLWINVMMLNLAVYSGYFDGVPGDLRFYLPFLVMALATPVIFYSAQPVFLLAWRGLRGGRVRMETLLALGISCAYGYSCWQAFHGSRHIYFDIACAITTLVLLGKWIERGCKERASRTIAGLYEMMPRKARVWSDADQRESFVSIDALRAGQLFVVKAGERIPADGVVCDGESHVDESLLTGESARRSKRVGDAVTGGSVNSEGVLRVRATAVGPDSRLAQILDAVERALGSRSEIEQNADRVSRVAIPLIIALALAVWAMSGDLMRAITVLVIACPCALGIATPLALTAAVGRASRGGVLVGDSSVLETIQKIDTVVFDKTGTLTEGRFTLLEANPADLPVIAAVERFSEHPLGRAVVENFPGPMLEAIDIEVYSGLGISGVVDGRRMFVGSHRLFDSASGPDGDGKTAVYYGYHGDVTGKLVFGDRMRPEAQETVARLRARGIHTLVVSGDSEAVTAWAARESGADEYRSEITPEGKVAILRELRERGKCVAMVGDGVNDAPALAAASLGIAMGAGTDLAMKAAAVVLMTNNLERVTETFDLAAHTLRVVRQNLFWAFAYNTIGIGLAAFGLLNPILASSAMVVSSLCVTANAVRLSGDP